LVYCIEGVPYWREVVSNQIEGNPPKEQARIAG